ncbi:MAG: hypothetical protein KDB88_05285, partial [Flavobacteriales bacterium]|nr:hypothetical protein [Flavobacteriales bacterium]
LLKGLDRWGVDTRAGIAVNYLTASLLAALFIESFVPERIITLLPWALAVGTAFIVVFHLTALSAQRAGVAATTVASKMSMIVPVLLAVALYSEVPGTFGWIGIGLALVGVALSTWSEDDRANAKHRALPVLLFFAFGAIDGTVSHVENRIMGSEERGVFSLLVFSTATLLGTTWTTRKDVRIALCEQRTWGVGALLGAVNFGALFCLFNALGDSGLPTSAVFPLVNILLVCSASLGASLWFRERITNLQWVGILTACLAMASILVAATQ